MKTIIILLAILGIVLITVVLVLGCEANKKSREQLEDRWF